MNNDLISRKALVAALIKEREQYPPMVAERYSFGVKLPHRFNQAMRGGIRKALRLVETAPAVEGTPVRRGEPVKYFEAYCNSDGEVVYELDGGYKCPFCGNTNIENFCPNCGAKMDKEKAGE